MAITDSTETMKNPLRDLMRRVPSPVTIVTAVGAGEARGATIGSFTSVSLEPPLISFNVDRSSQMHDVLSAAARFAVHIPCRGHAHLCAHFAVPDRSGVDQLSTIPHVVDAHGTPILESALAVIKCRTHDTFEAGDHSIVVGEVIDVEGRSERAPLLYYKRTYCSVTQEAIAKEEARVHAVS